MALWGNKDNVTSRGTVTLDYGTGIVVGNAGGSGTQFGAAGLNKKNARYLEGDNSDDKIEEENEKDSK